MTLDLLKKNIEHEKELVKRLEFLIKGQSQMPSEGRDKKNIELSIQATK